jgi:hypothetical protein
MTAPVTLSTTRCTRGPGKRQRGLRQWDRCLHITKRDSPQPPGLVRWCGTTGALRRDRAAWPTEPTLAPSAVARQIITGTPRLPPGLEGDPGGHGRHRLAGWLAPPMSPFYSPVMVAPT